MQSLKLQPAISKLSWDFDLLIDVRASIEVTHLYLVSLAINRQSATAHMFWTAQTSQISRCVDKSVPLDCDDDINSTQVQDAVAAIRKACTELLVTLSRIGNILRSGVLEL